MLMLVCGISFLATACSSDDDNEGTTSEIIGSWVEDTSSTVEVFHLIINSNNTAVFWAEDNGVVDSQGKKNCTWVINGGTITITYPGNDVESMNYRISGGKLYIGEIVYKRV